MDHDAGRQKNCSRNIAFAREVVNSEPVFAAFFSRTADSYVGVSESLRFIRLMERNGYNSDQKGGPT